jgi:hypothetical protein
MRLWRLWARCGTSFLLALQRPAGAQSIAGTKVTVPAVSACAELSLSCIVSAHSYPTTSGAECQAKSASGGVYDTYDVPGGPAYALEAAANGATPMVSPHAHDALVKKRIFRDTCRSRSARMRRQARCSRMPASVQGCPCARITPLRSRPRRARVRLEAMSGGAPTSILRRTSLPPASKI